LARLKFNVVIHGRSKDKLDAVQAEILKEHPETTVVCLVHDAGEKADWPRLIKQVEGLNITILINNVGSSRPCPFNSLEAATDEQIETVIRVNTIFPTQLTRNLLPTLLKNSPSLILNLTSAGIIFPPPFITVYCGTKAYNVVWSRALTNEMRYLNRDVTVKAVMTAEVQSESYDRPTQAFRPTAKVYAQSLLARADSSGSVYTGWWRHSLLVSGTRTRDCGSTPDLPSACLSWLDEGHAFLHYEWHAGRGYAGYARMAPERWGHDCHEASLEHLTHIHTHGMIGNAQFC
jgi:17beta-estradiol 17-dehydrogenase / very-long-chain 3-oxoacyl-CoA reductase